MTTATLRWHAPTHNTDGSPIVGTVTYSIYQISFRPEPVATGIHGTTYTVALTHPHLPHCFYVRAVVNGRLSSGSNIACSH